MSNTSTGIQKNTVQLKRAQPKVAYIKILQCVTLCIFTKGKKQTNKPLAEAAMMVIFLTGTMILFTGFRCNMHTKVCYNFSIKVCVSLVLHCHQHK